MKKNIYKILLFAITIGMVMSSCKKEEELITSVNKNSAPKNESGVMLKALPQANDNRVAYYAFDATTVDQDKPRLTDFTDNANIVVVFEGTLWELADSTHYGSTSAYILNINGGPYKYYSEILDDIQTLRQRGIKVLMNVDDASSWSTSTPFTTWNGIGYNYQQFASFVYDCVVSAGFDGISLDVEHGASDNSYYRNLISELGSYFGPLSPNANDLIYTGAFYSGGEPGPIFREVELSKYLNFVMDMGYFNDDQWRFDYWANTLGNSKVMIGFSHQLNSLDAAIAHAQWHPSPDKAGIMVFAGNVNKAYTDAIFAAMTPTAPGAATNPNPANSATGVNTIATLSWAAGSSATTHNVYFGTTSSPGFIGSQTGTSYNPGTLAENTTYYWRIDEQNSIGTTTGSLWSFTTGSGSSETPVTLTSWFNASYGIVSDGTSFSSTGGFDGEGYGYSSALLGSSITWNNTPFNLGPINSSDVISGNGQTITLPAGKYSALSMLAAGVGGNRPSQSFIVNYSDGSTSTFTQSISDWCTPQNYSGESKAVTMSYRNKYNGTKQTLTCNLYGYSFSLSNAKTISSIKLPNNSKVRVMAFTLVE